MMKANAIGSMRRRASRCGVGTGCGMGVGIQSPIQISPEPSSRMGPTVRVRRSECQYLLKQRIARNAWIGCAMRAILMTSGGRYVASCIWLKWQALADPM